MGVTGQSLPPKNDFEHAHGLRNSAYAVNLTYETYRQHISREISIEHPVWGSLRSPNYIEQRKLKNDVGLLLAQKRTKNKGYVELTLPQKQPNNSLKTDKLYDCNPYIVCILVFTALVCCTLCSDCSHILVCFQTVVVFCNQCQYFTITTWIKIIFFSSFDRVCGSDA